MRGAASVRKIVRSTAVWSVALGSVLGGAAMVAAAATSVWERVPAREHARANPLAGDPEAARAGAAVYARHCAQCHGAEAAGDARHPALRSERLARASDGDVEWFLRQGDLAHGMPSWSGLPQAQRWALVAYLRSLQRGR